jgi:hypothetical protein
MFIFLKLTTNTEEMGSTGKGTPRVWDRLDVDLLSDNARTRFRKRKRRLTEKIMLR